MSLRSTTNERDPVKVRKALDLRTPDFEKFILGMDHYLKTHPEKLAEIQKGIDESMREELEFLEVTSGACPIERVAKFRENLPTINMKDLQTEMGTNFYNIDLLKGMSCAIDSMFYTLPGQQGVSGPAERAKELISNLHVIGEESVHGYALSGDIKDAKAAFVVKVPQRKDNQDLLHEAFVGLASTNSLREKIPNFAFVYGAFKCPPPYIDSTTGQVVDWCGRTSNMSTTVPYVLYENIYPSITMSDYVAKGDVNQFLSGYIQTMFALTVANQEMDFTHYDLHGNNVLMRQVTNIKLGEVFQIPYEAPNGVTYYVVTDRVATIIDYGMSFVRYKGRPHGIHTSKYISYAVYPHRSWPLHDAYRLLMACGVSAYQANNKDVYREVEKIFSFFSNMKLLDALNEQNKFSYQLPKNDRISKYTLWDFMRHIWTVCECRHLVRDEPHSDYTILQCNRCENLHSISKRVGALEDIPRPQSFLDYYDVSEMIFSLGEIASIRVKKNFNYEASRRVFVEKYSLQMRELYGLITGSRTIALKSFEILDFDTMTLVRSIHLNLFKIISLLEELDVYSRAGIFMANMFEDEKLREWVISSVVKLRKYKSTTCELVSNSVENYRLIYEEIRGPKWKMKLKADPRLTWYLFTSGNVVPLEERTCQQELFTGPGYNVKPMPTLSPTNLSSIPPPSSPQLAGDIVSRRESLTQSSDGRQYGTVETITSPGLSLSSPPSMEPPAGFDVSKVSYPSVKEESKSKEEKDLSVEEGPLDSSSSGSLYKSNIQALPPINESDYEGSSSTSEPSPNEPKYPPSRTKEEMSRPSSSRSFLESKDSETPLVTSESRSSEYENELLPGTKLSGYGDIRIKTPPRSSFLSSDTPSSVYSHE